MFDIIEGTGGYHVIDRAGKVMHSCVSWNEAEVYQTYLEQKELTEAFEEAYEFDDSEEVPW